MQSKYRVPKFVAALATTVMIFMLTGCSETAPQSVPAPLTATGARSPVPQPPAGVAPVSGAPNNRGMARSPVPQPPTGVAPIAEQPPAGQ